MFYTVYKITNKVNGKIYIGVHKTSDLSDGYMGSGKLIKAAIEKYGIENFDREYLKVFNNPEDMFNMESELVNEEFIARDDTYNLKVGGQGGWDFINKNQLGALTTTQRATGAINANMSIKERCKVDIEYANYILHIKNTALINARIELKELYPNGTFNGKSHSDETKAKMSEKAKLRTGDKNSSFGSMWIMNSETKESKKIKKTDEIPTGWIKGRKLTDAK